jgi:hypothetical protein
VSSLSSGCVQTGPAKAGAGLSVDNSHVPAEIIALFTFFLFFFLGQRIV